MYHLHKLQDNIWLAKFDFAIVSSCEGKRKVEELKRSFVSNNGLSSAFCSHGGLFLLICSTVLAFILSSRFKTPVLREEFSSSVVGSPSALVRKAKLKPCSSATAKGRHYGAMEFCSVPSFSRTAGAKHFDGRAEAAVSYLDDFPLGKFLEVCTIFHRFIRGLRINKHSERSK